MAYKPNTTELLDGIAVFVAVIKASSFTAAAETLGRSTSYISKEITRLEKRLGSRLLNRTTRTISLTDTGRAYFERCEQIVIDAENAQRSINQLQDTPRGLLRVNAPNSFSQKKLMELLPCFLNEYPEIQLEVEFNDRIIDVVAEAFDVVVRVGQHKDSNLVARQLSRTKSVIVASPSYIKQHGTPKVAADLAEHHCIAYSLLPSPTNWEFKKDGKVSHVTIKPRALCNTAELEVSMVKQGIGITRLPLFCCEEEIKTGELISIMQDYDPIELGIYAVYPHRQYLTPKVRAFVDFLVEHIE